MQSAPFLLKKYLHYYSNCGIMFDVCVGNSAHDKTRMPIADRGAGENGITEPGILRSVSNKKYAEDS